MWASKVTTPWSGTTASPGAASLTRGRPRDCTKSTPSSRATMGLPCLKVSLIHALHSPDRDSVAMCWLPPPTVKQHRARCQVGELAGRRAAGIALDLALARPDVHDHRAGGGQARGDGRQLRVVEAGPDQERDRVLGGVGLRERGRLLVVALAGKGPGWLHADGVGHTGGQSKVDVVEDVHHALAHAHVVDLAQLERRRVEEVHLLPGR